MDLPATGNSQIDHGHGRLLALLEKLRYNPDNFIAVTRQLGESLQEHFEEEEALMRSNKYPGTDAHAKEHRALGLVLSVYLLDEVAGSEGYEQVLRAVDGARQVLLDHIEGLDHELAVYLVRKVSRAEARRKKKSAKGGAAAAAKKRSAR
jgi:hemerythrin-like metal-binding protein